jgi:flagellar M-ring protein FliF
MRLLGIGGVGLAVLAIIAGVALRASTEPMALLYGDLDLQDSGQVTATLDKLHVTYELKDGGTRILVPSDQVDRLRLALARDNLPTGGSVGYEIFDRGDALTSNQFQQQINQLRALEGELSRTIRSIRGVRNARVHLVMARREPFAREQQDAQASIMLSMAGAGRMDKGEVQAVVNLVSGAVPGLKPQNISVIDDRGEVLARPGRGTGPGGVATTQEELRRSIEQQMDVAVEDMLGRTLGPDHVRAEASVQMDFDRVAETQEKYDPDQQVARSTQTTTDGSKNTEAEQTVSVQNNLPNPAGQAGNASGSSSSHQEENTTYEIGKTVHTVEHDSPSISKISIAVLVDGVTSKGADGKVAWHELSQPDLDRLAVLVKSAVGFDAKRGDHVDVVNMRFNTTDDLADAPAPSHWLNLDKADLIWLVTIGIVGLVAIFALLFVVRPLALKLGAAVVPAPAASPALEAADTPPLLTDGTAPQATALVPAGGEESPDEDTMLNIASIDGEVKLSSIRKLTGLVETQPAASVSVIRGWLAKGA